MSSFDFVRLTKFLEKDEPKRECRLFEKERMSWFETPILSSIYGHEWGEKQKTSPLRTGLWGKVRFHTPQERETGFGPATFSLARKHIHFIKENVVFANCKRLSTLFSEVKIKERMLSLV